MNCLSSPGLGRLAKMLPISGYGASRAEPPKPLLL